MVDKSDEQPISIGGGRECGARRGVVEARSAKQFADGAGAGALGRARRTSAAFGARVFVVVCVLRRRFGHERGHGWAARDGGAGVSAISRGVRTHCSWGTALVRALRALASLERAERD